MAPSAEVHQRTHHRLLFEKLLNLRDSASPLTLVLDTLEQSAKPLLQEFMRRAKVVSQELAVYVQSDRGRGQALTLDDRLNAQKSSSSHSPRSRSRSMRISSSKAGARP